jgi:phosphate transport system protein
MKRLIDQGLEQLANMLFQMGELAYKTISLSLKNYIESADGYAQVREQSDLLVVMSEEAEDKASELIARFQPMASDFRILKSYIKTAYDFARYGRYAYDVSQIYERLGGLTTCEDWLKEVIEEMSRTVLKMVRTSIDSLKSHDTELAKTLSQTEKHVDAMYLKYLDMLVEKAPATNKCTISSVLVMRYLERIADHATYIGESVVYLATGEKITLR